MKKLTFLITLIIFVPLLTACGIKPIKQTKINTDHALLSEESYCYDTKMGTRLYQGVPNKFCFCQGEEIYRSECPQGMVCDSGTVYCQGEIKSIVFGYHTESNLLSFADLTEWGNYCQSLKENLNEKNLCLKNLEYTKSKNK